jgi:hypothetical protein
MLAVTIVASVSFNPNEFDKYATTQFIREFPRRSLIEPHKWCFDNKAGLHAQVQSCLQRLQGIIATVWVPREISLTHASNKMFNASSVGDRTGNRQKQDIATRNKGIWQAIRLHLDLDIARGRGFTNVSNHAQIDYPIFSETTRPIWKTRASVLREP